MMDEHEAAAIARAIIDANLYMMLGTADQTGRPWVSPVYYAPADDRDFLWVSDPDAQHSRNLRTRREVGIVTFDSSVPIDTGQAVYVSAVGQELAADECDAYSRRSLAHGGREWTRENVQAPARLRLYKATAVAQYVLDEHDERVPVTV